jgi:hypothetical protein
VNYSARLLNGIAVLRDAMEKDRESGLGEQFALGTDGRNL